MISFLYILLAVMLLLIVHSYILFPLYLRLSAGKKELLDNPHAVVKKVSVLMAAYNEEALIEEKIRSIYASDYPKSELQVYVGNDNSKDSTAQIIKSLQGEFPSLQLVDFKERQGKPSIMNKLADKSILEHKEEHMLLLTDVNVLFDEQMLTYLIKQIEVPYTGLVGAKVLFEITENKKGISQTESSYNDRELDIKYREGLLWGTMMGPFGAAYAMRSHVWKPIPKNFIVDDFWVNMSVLSQGWNTVMSEKARAFEKIVDNAQVEYKRKVRMSTGNLQNLNYFKKLLFSKRKGLSFSFWSHKVLRWMTPVFMLLIYIIIWILFAHGQELKFVLYVIHAVLLLCALDIYLGNKGIWTGPIRYLRHFLMMNMAMLQGYKNYYSQKASSIWEPTKRNNN